MIQETLTEALGQSEVFLQFQERLALVAPVDRPILLLGERGTGKELAARRVHYLSGRWQGPLVTLNCAALAPTLIEAELFGAERGACTGAEKRRRGRFEAADGGTLFLDEIGNIPMVAQEKILRAVEYGVFERVGGAEPVEVDVRIVGATNANLPAMAERGEFKADLLDRLSFEVLFLPPLRIRSEDIVLLARHFAGRMALELGCTALPEFSKKALLSLEQYHWPGNIRELKNVVERAVYSAKNNLIEHVVFSPFHAPWEETSLPGPSWQGTTSVCSSEMPETRGQQNALPSSLKAAVKQVEQDLVKKALRAHQYNRRQAATALDLSYDQLRALIRKHGPESLGLS